MASVIRPNGIDPHPVIPDKKKIQAGEGPGPISLGEIRPKIGKSNADNPIYKALEWTQKYLGWIASNEPYKESKPAGGGEPPPAPPGGAAPGGAGAAPATPGYSRGARILRFPKSYTGKDRDRTEQYILEDARENGIDLRMLPGYDMRVDPDGHYKGNRAWVNRDLKYHQNPLELGKVASHEIIEAILARDTDISTETAHNIARSNELHMAIDYAMGQRNVARKYAERAMNALRAA